MILALLLTAIWSATDPATAVAECGVISDGPTTVATLAWNPETWRGPEGGDPIALGEIIREAVLGWQVQRTGDTWLDVLPVTAGTLSFRRVEIQGFHPDPPLVIGAPEIRCGSSAFIFIRPLGALVLRWDEARRLYVGPNVVAARYGGTIRVWVWIYDGDGRLEHLAMWRAR